MKNNFEKENSKINSKTYLIFLILFSIGIIIVASYLITNEILDAKKSCENLGGLYSIEFLKGHLCNGERFVKYNSCIVLGGNINCNLDWVFENSVGEINISQSLK